jgi:hypothetical protein
MKYRINIRADKKEPPELDRVVAVLLALALARVEQERAEQNEPAPPPKEASD